MPHRLQKEQIPPDFIYLKIQQNEGITDEHLACGLLLSWGGVGTSGNGEVVEKGHRRVNAVQILYIHVCKSKNVSRDGGRVVVEGGKSSDILDTL
jgi:hypothetical protein